MTDFDAILAAIENEPAELTLKYVLADFCGDTLCSMELAELVRAKIDLLGYPPVRGPMNQWVRNPKMSAELLRQRIRELESELIEDDDTESAMGKIELSFAKCLAVIQFLHSDDDIAYRRVWIKDMARQIAMKPPIGEEEPARYVDELEELLGQEDANGGHDDNVDVTTPEGQQRWRQYADEYTDISRDEMVARMRRAAVPLIGSRMFNEESTDAVTGEVPSPGSD